MKEISEDSTPSSSFKRCNLFSFLRPASEKTKRERERVEAVGGRGGGGKGLARSLSDQAMNKIQ